MAIPRSKIELIEAIEHNFDRLMREYQGVPIENMLENTLEGHNKDSFMSLHNLIAYQVGWHRTVLDWHNAEINGDDIVFPTPNFKWNELGKLALKFYEDYETVPSEELLVLLQQTKFDIVDLVSSYSDHELYGVNWYKNYTRGRMIQFNTSSPYKNAYSRIRKWKKTKGV